MDAGSPSLMTAEEFFEWRSLPQNDNRFFELVRGEVLELPFTTHIQGVVCANVGFTLGLYARKISKGYPTCNDCPVILSRNPDTVRGPDLAYYFGPSPFEESDTTTDEVLPHLAIEVLPPEGPPMIAMAKLDDYLAARIPLIWYVDPRRCTVTVYQPDKASRVFTREQTLSGEGVLPDFACYVHDFFCLPWERREHPDNGS